MLPGADVMWCSRWQLGRALLTQVPPLLGSQYISALLCPQPNMFTRMTSPHLQQPLEELLDQYYREELKFRENLASSGSKPWAIPHAPRQI